MLWYHLETADLSHQIHNIQDNTNHRSQENSGKCPFMNRRRKVDQLHFTLNIQL